MASDLNKAILVGRLVRDPEMKFTGAGTGVCNFSIAVNKTYVQAGEKKEQTSFFNCIAWSKAGEIISQYCTKGSRIGIEGKLQQRSWEDQTGSKRSTVEIVVDNFQFLSSKGEVETDIAQKKPETSQPDFNDNPFTDDDIPF